MANKGPLPGQYNTFFLPIRKDARKAEPNVSQLTGTDVWERAYIKEAAGMYLLLPLAPSRNGVYKNGPNKGRTFKYRNQRASVTWKIILKPNTMIQAFNSNPANGAIGTIAHPRSSISLCLPPTVTVSEMLAWLANPTIVNDIKGEDITAYAIDGYDLAKNYESIIALITPSERKHPVRAMTAKNSPPMKAPTEPATQPDLSPPGGTQP